MELIYERSVKGRMGYSMPEDEFDSDINTLIPCLCTCFSKEGTS